jgi:hypothetical protein
VTLSTVLEHPPIEAPVIVHPRVRPRLSAHLIVVAGYIGLGLLVMGRLVVDPRGQVSAHLAGDHTWFQWLLAHGEYSVRHLQNPLFSTRQNYPTGVNMMANTSVLGVTIPLAPVTWLLGPRIAYVVWMVGAMAGTATVTYWVLLRHVVRSRVAAGLAGALAGFAPGVIHHANGQPNFVSNFLLPLIVLRVTRLGLGGRWRRDGVVLAALVTYQLFLNEELLLITAAACGVLVVAYAINRPAAARQRAAGFLRALLVTAGVAGALCVYPIWFQFHGPGTFRGMPAFNTWGEDPLTYLTFPRDTLAGTTDSEATVGLIEQNSWFGWPLTLLVLVLAVVLWRRSVTVRVAAIVAVACAVLSIGPVLRLGGLVTGHPGPLAALPRHLPVLSLLMPSRLTYAVLAAFVVILAIGFDRLGRPVKLIAVLALVPLIPTPLPAVPDQRPPAFITSGAWRPYVPEGSTMVPVPPPSSWAGRDSLSWSAWTHQEFRIPEGYFLGPGPDGAGQAGPTRISHLTELANRTRKAGAAPAVTGRDRATVRAELRNWRASVVVVRADPAHDTLRNLMTRLLGNPRRAGDVWLWTP